MRRGQALKFQKDFALAKADFEEAKKWQKDQETDVDKWLSLNEADRLHEEKLKAIMDNADSLAGKEYIDYLLSFLRGKKDDSLQQNAAGTKKRRGQICFHEFTKEENAKLKKTLAAADMVYYFNVQEGLKVLVDSLYITPQALPLVQELLDKDAKLQDGFQRQHLFEALIDYMQT